jgi:SET domain-containing protein
MSAARAAMSTYGRLRAVMGTQIRWLVLQSTRISGSIFPLMSTGGKVCLLSGVWPSSATANPAFSNVAEDSMAHSLPSVAAPGDGCTPLIASGKVEARIDLVVAKHSPIHGQGLFALSHIPAGTRVIQYVGQTITKRESLERCEGNNEYIFALDGERDLDGSVEWNLARLINHHCAPNCEAELAEGRIWVVAKRDICPDEEITFNYGYDLESYREHPCRCGASECVGYIVAEEFFPLIRTHSH